ncbi:hypothetical protein [Mastigocoleus testarum]|nr:hypothetical protein [Mastigocoleus testarum]
MRSRPQEILPWKFFYLGRSQDYIYIYVRNEIYRLAIARHFP